MLQRAQTISNSRAWCSATDRLKVAFSFRPSASLLLATAFVVASVVRFPADDFRLEMLFLFKAALAVGLAVSIARSNPWLGLFVALAAVSHFYPAYDRASHQAFEMVLYGAAWFVVVRDVFGRRHLSTLLDAICIVAAINALYTVLQVFNIDPLFRPVHGGTDDVEAGLMGNVNFSSALFAMSFPAFLRRGRYWGLVFILFGLLATRTSLGPVSVAVGWVFWMALRGKIFVSLCLSVGAVLLYAGLVDMPGFERLGVWQQGLSAWSERPIMGYGLGHWPLIFSKPMVTGTVWVQAHNEFLQALFEMGSGFLLIAAGYYFRFAKKLKARAKPQGSMTIAATGIVVVTVNALGNFPFHIATTAMLAVTWLAICEIVMSDK